MRRSLIIALGGAVAVVAAADAIAALPTAVGVSEATATFSTDKASPVRSRECTGADGKAWKVTDGHYTGTSVSTNVILAGPLTIHARTTYSTTDALGYVDGSFKVRDDDSRVSGHFTGTLKAGKLVGFLTAKSRGNHAKVLGNISANFDPAATAAFTSGALGSGATGALAVVAGPVCKKPAPKPKPVRPVHVKGEVTALSASEITVTSKGPTTTKCAIGATSPATAGLLNKRVEMTCEYLGTPPTQVWTLTKIKLHS